MESVLSNLINPNDPEKVDEAFAEQQRFINGRIVPFVSAAGLDKIDSRIFKVNALGALQQRLLGSDGAALEATGMPAFERGLREFLALDRDAVRREKDVNIAESIEQDVSHDVIALARKARAPIANYEAEQAKLDAELEQLRRIKGNIESIIRANAADTAAALGQGLEAYLSERLFNRLREHAASLDLGDLESIWTQFRLLADYPVSWWDGHEGRTLGKRIEIHLQQQVTQLITRHIDEWRDAHMELELKARTADLQQLSGMKPANTSKSCPRLEAKAGGRKRSQT